MKCSYPLFHNFSPEFHSSSTLNILIFFESHKVGGKTSGINSNISKALWRSPEREHSGKAFAFHTADPGLMVVQFLASNMVP